MPELVWRVFIRGREGERGEKKGAQSNLAGRGEFRGGGGRRELRGGGRSLEGEGEAGFCCLKLLKGGGTKQVHRDHTIG